MSSAEPAGFSRGILSKNVKYYSNRYNEIVPVHDFQLVDDKPLIDEFIKSASWFISSLNAMSEHIIKVHEYVSKNYDVHTYINRLDLIVHALIIVSAILNSNGVYNDFTMTREKLLNTTDVERFDMINLPYRKFTFNSVDGTPPDISLDIWGPNMWKFLHLASILLKGEHLTNHFAMMMKNFDQFIWCPSCKENYRRKLPMDNIVIPIIISKNPIFIIYTLHNMVNVQKYGRNVPIRLTDFIKNVQSNENNKNVYSFESFCTSYGLRATKKVDIIYDVTL